MRDNIHICVQREASLTKAHADVLKLEQVSDLTAEMIGRLVERIIVYPEGRIYVQLSFLEDTVNNRLEGGADHE